MITLIKLMLIGAIIVITSVVYGKCLNKIENREISAWIITGFCSIVAICEVTSVIAVSLDVFVNILLLLNSIVVVGIMCILCFINKEKLKQWEKIRIDFNELIIIFIVLAQAFFLALFYFKPYGADAFAMGISTRAYETNVLYSENPFTGAETDIMDKKLRISPYILLVAGIARVFKIHPMTIFHTGIPILIIIIMALIYYQVASLYTRKKNSRLIFVGIMFLINIFYTGYDIRANTGLFMAAWHGKMIVANIFIPAVWYYACDAMDNENHRSWSFLFIVMVAALFFSITGALFCPAILMCIILYYAVSKKKIIYCIYGLVMIIPALLALGLYIRF